MPSHLSTIGLTLATREDFIALAQRVAAIATPIPAKWGRYMRWSSDCGAECDRWP